MKIVTSDGLSFFMRSDYLQSVAPQNIVAGADFTDDESDDIVQAGFAFAAERQALSFLNRSEHSRYMLECKLEKKGHAKQAVKRALDRLEEKKLLDDLRFAQAWLHNRLITKAEGPLRLSGELASRGVKRDLIDKALAALFENVGVDELFARACAKLERSGKSGKKLEDALIRKGFDLRSVRSIRSIRDESQYNKKTD